ncbi:MAG TPA: ATP-binding cassette domain-containing protein, partial [Burkholderiaceae bacterium]|nr:ATP-binding cassette domain-containing protein [Burkholderiaceae bacterium]
MPEPSVQDWVQRTLADAMGRAEPPAEPLVLLEQAGVRFGDVQALRGVSLTLRRGDRLARVGANGSGKTTLLRLLHGLVPFEGRRDVVAIIGRVPVVAMLFQRPFLLSLSVRWNVLLGLWLHGVPRAQRDRRCQRALQRVGLDALAGFGRAASEVGAVMIVGGNIEGVTRVMTTTIALETSKGDLPLALALGVILIAIVLSLNALAYVLREWAVKRH